MAEEKGTPVVGFPTREIRVTGERVGNMIALTISTSRFEQSLIQMSMSGAPAVRRVVREATDLFQRALNEFEDNLRDAQKVLDQVNRGPGQQGRRTPARPQVQRQQQAGTAQKPAPEQKPAAAAQQKPAAQPKPQAPAQAPQKAEATEVKSAPAPAPAPEQAAQRQQQEGQKPRNQQGNDQAGQQQQPRSQAPNNQSEQRGNQQGQQREQRQPQSQAVEKSEAELAPILD